MQCETLHNHEDSYTDTAHYISDIFGHIRAFCLVSDKNVSKEDREMSLFSRVSCVLVYHVFDNELLDTQMLVFYQLSVGCIKYCNVITSKED